MFRYDAPYRRVNRPAFTKKAGTIIKIAIAVLLVAIIGLSIAVASLGNTVSDAKSYSIDQMQSESGQACRIVNELSRTGNSSSYNQLARIRSRIYAIQTINRFRSNVFGEKARLLSDDVFTSIYALLDEYEVRVNTGTNTSETQSALSAQINALNDYLDLAD